MGTPLRSDVALGELTRRQRVQGRLALLMPGILLCALVAMAAKFAHLQTGLPVILLAVGFGMLLPGLSLQSGYGAGIDWCASTLLRLGVAMMGVRLGLDQVASAGPSSLLLAVLCIPGTLAFSYWLGRWLGLGSIHSLVAGAAVAVCGVAAALAVIASLPRERRAEAQLGPIILGVTLLSTLAMIAYPSLAHWLGMAPLQTALFLGGTIHDVAQVAGAGALMSEEVSELALFTKMTRVAMLAPLALAVAWWMRSTTDRGFPVPLFLIGFIAMAILGNSGWLVPELRSTIVEISNACLLVTMAALGCKTLLSVFGRAGVRPLSHILLNTVFIALLGLGIASLV